MFIRKTVSVVTALLLILQLIIPNALFITQSYAQEEIASETAAVVTQTEEITPTVEPIPTTEPTLTETPTPMEEATPTPEPTAISPTPTDVPQPTETVPPVNLIELTVTPTPPFSPWQDNLDGSVTTLLPVVKNIDYNYKNTALAVRFSEILIPGTLTIREIKLTNEQKASVSSFSDTAYEITSTMPDETFTYDLTLPLPEEAKGKEIQVKSSEHLDDIDSASTVDQQKEIQSNIIIIKNLNHFTVFVLVNDIDTDNPDNLGDSDDVANGTLSAIEDTYADQNSPTTTRGSSDDLNIRSKSGSDNQRAYVKFDTSSITSGSTVSKATLRLFLTSAPGESRNYDVYRVTGSWSESTLDWDPQPGVSGSMTSSTTSGTTDSVWREWDVTADVQDFIDGDEINYGWMIRDRVEDSSTGRQGQFFSSERDNELRRPQLVVDLSEPSDEPTDYRSPTANAATTGGDNNGFETNPTNAYADGAGTADNLNGAGDRHMFYNYGFGVPSESVISGIEVRSDWRVNDTDGTNSLSIALSWDGGSSWTSSKSDITETDKEHAASLGGASDDWGHGWSVSDLSDGNFRVLVTANSTSGTKDFYLDWIPVRIYYTTNASPVANDDGYSTDEDTSLNVEAAGVLENDTDAEGNPLTAVKDTDPGHGALTLNSDGSFTYTPEANYNGQDSFTYHANDGSLDSNTTTVSLTVNPVNDPPTTIDLGPYITNEEETVSLFAPGVLSFATDPDSDPLTAALVSDVANGTLLFNTDGSFDYTSNVNYNGADSFTYVANDGTADSNVSSVTIIVSAVNDAPVIDSVSITPSDPRTNNTLTANVTAHDDDDDGLNYSYQWKKNDENVGGDSSTLNLSTAGNGDKNDVMTVTVTADDGNGGTDTKTSGQVTVQNSAPGVSIPEGYVASGPEDTDLLIDLSAFISDVDNDPLTYSIYDDNGRPWFGTLVLSGSDATYTPLPDFIGDDNFSFQAFDGTVNSNVAQLFITITAVNDAPVAVDDISSTNQNTAVDIPVLANDTDVENSPLTPAIVDGPAHGAVLVNGDNTIHYTPDLDYHGSDSFTYEANDGNLDSNVATVSITVIDNVSPTLTSAETQDTNNDGNIDAITLTFNENIDDFKLNPGTADGWDVADPAGSESIGTGNTAYDNVLLLSFGQGPNPDTGNTPNVTYTRIWSRSTHDLAGNELANGTWQTTDSAKPVLLSAETQDISGNGNIDAIQLTFSENIDDTKLNKGNADGWDVVDYGGEAIDTGAGDDDNVLLLSITEGSSYDVNTTPTIRYTNSNDFTSTHDVAGNELASLEKTTTDKAAPIIPAASPAGGDYDSDQTVTLTAEAGAEIRYTTDGTVPSATTGTVYSAPIVIGTDTVLKAVATDAAGNTSPTMTETYTIAPVISAETSSSATTTAVTITWTTDDPATSRVIYDTVSHVSLGSAPNYGYANSTVEDPTKVTSHSVDLTGLTAGTTYYYRTVSHGSPEAVSAEQSFATTSTTTDGGGGGGGGGGGAGDGLSDGLSGKAPVCNDAKPGSAPTLLSAAAGTNSVTLTWSEATTPVTYYLVTYGTGPGLQQFGNPNVGGIGTTSYTISGLSGGSTYYFKVRAGNGCKPGDYSNELLAAPGGGFIEGPAAGFIPGVLGTTTETSPTPVPTPGNILGTQGQAQQTPWWSFFGGFFGSVIQWLKNIFRL